MDVQGALSTNSDTPRCCLQSSPCKVLQIVAGVSFTALGIAFFTTKNLPQSLVRLQFSKCSQTLTGAIYSTAGTLCFASYLLANHCKCAASTSEPVTINSRIGHTVVDAADRVEEYMTATIGEVTNDLLQKGSLNGADIGSVEQRRKICRMAAYHIIAAAYYAPEACGGATMTIGDKIHVRELAGDFRVVQGVDVNVCCEDDLFCAWNKGVDTVHAKEWFDQLSEPGKVDLYQRLLTGAPAQAEGDALYSNLLAMGEQIEQRYLPLVELALQGDQIAAQRNDIPTLRGMLREEMEQQTQQMVQSFQATQDHGALDWFTVPVNRLTILRVIQRLNMQPEGESYRFSANGHLLEQCDPLPGTQFYPGNTILPMEGIEKAGIERLATLKAMLQTLGDIADLEDRILQPAYEKDGQAVEARPTDAQMDGLIDELCFVGQWWTRATLPDGTNRNRHLEAMAVRIAMACLPETVSTQSKETKAPSANATNFNPFRDPNPDWGHLDTVGLHGKDFKKVLLQTQPHEYNPEAVATVKESFKDKEEMIEYHLMGDFDIIERGKSTYQISSNGKQRNYCLFAAVAEAVLTINDKNPHIKRTSQLVKLAASYIETFPEKFRTLIPDRTVQEHTQGIRDGLWAGHPEIEALAGALDRRIWLWDIRCELQPKVLNGRGLMPNFRFNEETGKGEPIKLLFNGTHFVLLVHK